MRNYGNIATAIWQDLDFRGLTMNAQRTYMLIITQHNISSVGTLAVTLQRWARMARDASLDALSDGLAELDAARFIAIDWDEEELLVRTFVKWDGGHTNPKRMLSIRSAAKAVTSPILAPILAYELTSLGVDHGMSSPQVDSHSDADRMPIESPRVVVTTEVSPTTHNPQTSTHNPQPTTRNPQTSNTHSEADASAAAPASPPRSLDRHQSLRAGSQAAQEPRSTPPEGEDSGPPVPEGAQSRSARYTDDFETFWSHYPRKTAKIKTFSAWKVALRRASAEALISAATRMSKDPNLPDENFIPHPTTWLSQGRWDDPPYPPRDAPSRASPPRDEGAVRLQRAGTPPIPGGLTLQQERAWRTRWCELIKAGQSPDQATRIATAELAA